MSDLIASTSSEGVISIVIIFGVFALVANLIAYYRGFFKLPVHQDQRTITFVQTSVCLGIYLIVSFLLSPFVFSLILQVGQKASTQFLHEYKTKVMVFQALTAVLNVSFIALYLNSQKRKQVASLFKDPSMRNHSFFYDFLMGVFTWFLAFPVVVAINHICDYLNKEIFKVSGADQVAVRYLKSSSQSFMTLFFAIFMIIIIAPLIEEFIFRGCIQNYLRKKMGTKASIIFSSLIFSFMHFSISQKAGNFPLITSLFVFSLYLGFLYEKTRSLYAPMILHLTFNSVSVVRILLTS